MGTGNAVCTILNPFSCAVHEESCPIFGLLLHPLASDDVFDHDPPAFFHPLHKLLTTGATRDAKMVRS